MTIDLPAEVEVGVYANFVSVWHDQDSFTLDFAAVTRPGVTMHDEETGQAFIGIGAKIAARVRIPPSQVFEIMKALEQQLSAWEIATGKLRPNDP